MIRTEKSNFSRTGSQVGKMKLRVSDYENVNISILTALKISYAMAERR